jgi:hypothetical protein
MNMTAKTQATLYEKDFYHWALQSAQELRQGKVSDVNVEYIAEELESMGRSDKRELINRFAILLAHLLKWHLQPERRCNGWKYTIEEQRFEIKDLLEESPSLKHELQDKLEHAYKKALLIAATETGLAKNSFPKTCPFAFEKVLNPKFLPDH